MTMLVTILGFGQFFGQLFFGFVANYSVIDELILYNIGAILCGVASCLIPFVAYSYLALRLTILLFGLSISANYALTSIILANMCGLELLTSAYGLILLGQGLSSLLGPILGGKKKNYRIIRFQIFRFSFRLDCRKLWIQIVIADCWWFDGSIGLCNNFTLHSSIDQRTKRSDEE